MTGQYEPGTEPDGAAWPAGPRLGGRYGPPPPAWGPTADSLACPRPVRGRWLWRWTAFALGPALLVVGAAGGYLWTSSAKGETYAPAAADLLAAFEPDRAERRQIASPTTSRPAVMQSHERGVKVTGHTVLDRFERAGEQYGPARGHTLRTVKVVTTEGEPAEAREVLAHDDVSIELGPPTGEFTYCIRDSPTYVDKSANYCVTSARPACRHGCDGDGHAGDTAYLVVWGGLRQLARRCRRRPTRREQGG